jgi:hypothetical protein
VQRPRERLPFVRAAPTLDSVIVEFFLSLRNLPACGVRRLRRLRIGSLRGLLNKINSLDYRIRLLFAIVK